jgi:DNA-binding response OmpR family regulator
MLLTAKDLPDDRQRAREPGALSLLAKPHHGQVLVDLVNAVAASRAPRELTS